MFRQASVGDVCFDCAMYMVIRGFQCDGRSASKTVDNKTSAVFCIPEFNIEHSVRLTDNITIFADSSSPIFTSILSFDVAAYYASLSASSFPLMPIWLGSHTKSTFLL